MRGPPDGAHIPNGELKSATPQSPDVGFIRFVYCPQMEARDWMTDASAMVMTAS